MNQQAVRSGAVSGLIAVIPMTVTLVALRKITRLRVRPLPPERVTQGVLRKAGVRQLAPYDSSSFNVVFLLSHFTFGLCAGVLLGQILKRTQERPGWIKRGIGVAMGLCVWLVSYWGWIPISGLLHHRESRSSEYNVVMGAAHAIWGFSAADIFERFRGNIGKTFSQKHHLSLPPTRFVDAEFT